MPDRPAALLLDLDGTLVNSEPFHRGLYRRWFASHGWPVDEALLTRFTGQRADDVLAHTDGPWAGQDIPTMVQELLNLMHTATPPDLMDGARELIDQANVPLALVTSAQLAWARICLGTRLRNFQVLVTRDDVRHGKPDPEPYLTACLRLGISPARVWTVEDAPAGVASARAAGVGRVVAITTTFPSSDLTAAHRIVPGLLAVQQMLDET